MDHVLAGVAGFEPTNAGVKVPCLTAWLHPNVNLRRLRAPAAAVAAAAWDL